MRVGVFVGFALWLLLGSVCWADNISLSWTLTAPAKSYNLYQSVDVGLTWQKIGNFPAPPVTITVPGDKLVLLLVCGVSGAGEVCLFTKGAWYNGSWNTITTGLNVGP